MIELLNAIPFGVEIAALLVALASMISAIVPDSKLGAAAPIFNWIALNVGKAVNDPRQND
jgi:hypothetical protein|tara:strand:+ start:195 stop:374 length:180 start_codon:yes stop_codon:yes gene_type:complete